VPWQDNPQLAATPSRWTRPPLGDRCCGEVLPALATDIDLALVQVADVVLRLQDTVDVQGELLDLVIEQALPDRRSALGGHCLEDRTAS
jgi:hypothetical protein